MTQRKLLAGAAVALLAVTGAVSVQAQVVGQPIERAPVETRPPLTPVQERVGVGLAEEIEDVELRVQRELARAEDEARFGLAAVPPGFAGSVSLTGIATWGNTDTVDVGLAGRFTLGQGAINHSFGLGFEYGEADGERSRNRVLGIYDLTYDFTPQIYAFGLARGVYDEFAPLNERDVFIGAGPGFRVINQPDMAWRVQAGPGLRHTRNVETGETDNDLAGILSSRAFFAVSPDMFITNDTDVLHSDVDTLVSNELALNTRIAGPLSARVGYRLDYTTDPVFDEELGRTRRSTDHRVSLGVVYSFQ